MSELLSRDLARLHARFNVFPTAIFDAKDSLNIVDRIAGIEELAYLHDFYRNYEDEYRKAEVGEVQPLAGVATSADLPFIGESALKSGSAKYIFVFIGSLSAPTHLSSTVLSCLWPIASFRQIQSIFCTFWPTTYFNIVSGMGITEEIAKKSYVIDAVRTPYAANNRTILYREIELLNPELVILVGGVPEGLIDNAARTAEPDRYFRVNFPNNGRSAARIASDELLFTELRRRFSRMEQ